MPARDDQAFETPTMRRRALVYGLAAAIALIMIAYCLLLVLDEEMAQTRSVRLLVLFYPFIVGFVSLACVLYTHLTPYVTEFKIGWTVVIVAGALLSLSAFVLPVFWYLQVWAPFRGKPAVAGGGTS